MRRTQDGTRLSARPHLQHISCYFISFHLFASLSSFKVMDFTVNYTLYFFSPLFINGNWHPFLNLPLLNFSRCGSRRGSVTARAGVSAGHPMALNYWQHCSPVKAISWPLAVTTDPQEWHVYIWSHRGLQTGSLCPQKTNGNEWTNYIVNNYTWSHTNQSQNHLTWGSVRCLSWHLQCL